MLDVLSVALHDFLLCSVDFLVIVRLQKGIDHLRHPSHHQVFPEQRHEMLMDSGIHLLLPLKEASQRLDGRRSPAHGPKIFLEIQGVHFHGPLIAHGNRGHLLIAESQHRAGGDDIIPVIDSQEFQRCPGIGTVLNLVQENQGLFFQEPDIPDIQRYLLVDFLRLQRAFKYPFVLRIPVEIQIHIAFILSPPELLDDESLPNLPGPLHQEALPAFPVFPVQELVVNLPFQHIRHLPMVCFSFIIRSAFPAVNEICIFSQDIRYKNCTFSEDSHPDYCTFSGHL